MDLLCKISLFEMKRLAVGHWDLTLFGNGVERTANCTMNGFNFNKNKTHFLVTVYFHSLLQQTRAEQLDEEQIGAQGLMFD